MATTTEIARLRGLLAEHKISHRQFAETMGMDDSHVSRILAESIHPGELARIKMARACKKLGLGAIVGDEDE